MGAGRKPKSAATNELEDNPGKRRVLTEVERIHSSSYALESVMPDGFEKVPVKCGTYIAKKQIMCYDMLYRTVDKFPQTSRFMTKTTAR